MTKLNIDKTNLRALMRRIRYLQFVIKHPEVKSTPDCFMSWGNSQAGALMFFPKSRDEYKMFCREGYKFKDADLVNEWLQEMLTPEQQRELSLIPGKESFHKIIVSEAVKKAKADIVALGKEILKDEMVKAMKKLVDPTEMIDVLIQTVPVLGQFAGLGLLFVLIFTLFLHVLCILPIFICYYTSRDTRAWVHHMENNLGYARLWSNVLFSALAGLAAPAGPVVKWALVTHEVWATGGGSTRHGSKVKYMKTVTGGCCGSDKHTELQNSLRLLNNSELYTPELRKIRESFDKYITDIAVLTAGAEATEARVQEELDQAILATKDMKRGKFNDHIKKLEKARSQALKKQKKDLLSMLDFTELTYNFEDLIKHNVATQVYNAKVDAKRIAAGKKPPQRPYDDIDSVV